jgi:4-hydroxy-tetrahydrodipicolinate reductase
VSTTYKVIQWATGEVGSLCVREVARRPGLELVGLRVYDPAKDGRDAGEIVGIEPLGVHGTTDRDAIIAMDADCVIHAPLAADLQALDDDVVALLASGKNVISTAAYFAPEFRGREVAERLEAACAQGGATLLGTGVEPGFMFERVMPTVTGMCTDIDHIRLVEVIDAARHPAAMMVKEALGIGKPVEAVTGDSPFGQYFRAFFSEMATAAGRALGVDFEGVDSGLDVAPASRDLEIAVGTVAKGTVAGTRYWVDGIVGGRTFLRAEVYWLVEPGVTGWPAPADRYQWHVEIAGRPSVRLTLDALPSLDGSGEDYDPGFHATMATAVNAVPAICEAPPGIFHQPVFAPWSPLLREASGVG